MTDILCSDCGNPIVGVYTVVGTPGVKPPTVGLCCLWKYIGVDEIAERDATIAALTRKIEELENGWQPVSEFKEEHCRKPCWTWGPKRVAPTIALGDFADGLWFHEVRSGTAPWSHWSDIDEDEPLIDNDGFSSVTHFTLLPLPPPPVTDEGL